MHDLKYTILLTITATFLGVLPGYAQSDSCAAFVQDVAGFMRSPRFGDIDVLQSLVTSAEEGRSCYGDVVVIEAAWLTLNEILALDRLGRFREAEDLTDLFYDKYWDIATKDYVRYRGQILAWRLHFAELRGDVIRAMRAYTQAQAYRDSISVDLRLSLDLDLALLYGQLGDYESAVSIVEAVEDKTMRAAQENTTLPDLQARTLQEAGKLTLIAFWDTNQTDLEGVRRAADKLRRATGLFENKSETRQAAETYSILAEAQSLLAGSVDPLTESIQQARIEGHAGAVIHGLWRRGRVFQHFGRLDEAEHDLRQALIVSDSTGVRRFDLKIQLRLGKLFLERRRLRAARDILHVVAESDASDPNAIYRAAKEIQEARRLYATVARDLAAQRVLRWKWAFLAACLLIALLAGLAVRYHYLWRSEHRRNRDALALQSGPPDLADRRRGFIFTVLSDPDSTQERIQDDYLRAHLLQGVTDLNILYLCAAALEGTDLKSPVATYKQTFRRAFRKRGWGVPDSVAAWRKHFEDHPLS